MWVDAGFRPGLVLDDGAYTARPYAIATNWIRWVDHHAQARGGWQLATSDPAITGIGRGIATWADNVGTTYAAIGTHTKLWVFVSGAVYDVTPFRVLNHALANNPITTTNGSAVVTVADTAHGAVTGDSVYLNGATAVATIQLGGISGTYANNPFLTTSGSPVVKVTAVAHGLVSGSMTRIAGSAAVGGITPSGLYTIRKLDADTFLIMHTASATSSATGGGAAATYDHYISYVLTVVDANSYTVTAATTANAGATGGGAGVTTYYEISVGNQNGLTGSGYGTGTYGGGPYGLGSQPTALSQPRTWSIVNFGQNVCCNPLGGGIYEWSRNWSTRAAILTNAPAYVLAIATTVEQTLMAAGTDFNGAIAPLFLRWSDAGAENTWTAATNNLAGSLRLGYGSSIVGMRQTKAGTFVWTDVGAYLVGYTSQAEQPYLAALQGTGCGLIGPNAGMDLGGTLYWVTPQANFYVWAGGTPQPIPNPCRQWFQRNLSSGQAYKIFAVADVGFTGIDWLFPSTVSNECDTYIRLDALEMAKDPRAGWSASALGGLDRTCGVDAGVFSFPILVSSGGVLYLHENGTSANGAPITRGITFAPWEPSGQDGHGTHKVNMRGFTIDTAQAFGSFAVTVTSRRMPNDTGVANGPFTWNTVTPEVTARVQGGTLQFAITSFGDRDQWRLGEFRLDVWQGPRTRR